MALSSLLRAGVAPVGVPFASELGGLLEELEGFNAYKKPLVRPGGALQPLLWPCGGFCVREWRVLGLPFPCAMASPNPPNLPNPPKVRPAPQGKGTPTPNRLEKQTAICLSCCPSPSLSTVPPLQLGGSAAPGR